MFKRVLSRYFNWKFSKRVLILWLVFTIFFAGFDLFISGTINVFFPDKEVYAHFDDITGKIIEKQSLAVLGQPDELLKDYTISTDFTEDTFIITLYGHNYEALRLVFSYNDYYLLSYKRFHESTHLMFVFLIACLFVYCLSGIALSLIFNLSVTGLKYISERCICKEFDNSR